MSKANNEKLILSLYCGHDSTVCITRGKELIINLELERFSRIKEDWGYDERFTQYCLSEAGFTIDDIDELVVCKKVSPGKDSKLLNYSLPSSIGLKPKSPDELCFKGKATILNRRFDAYFVHHHLAHLASAYYSSPFKDSCVISLDGGGEGINYAIAHGHNNVLEVKKMMWSPCIGYLWEFLPKLLNNLKNGPGKWMALAAYGKQTPKYRSILIDALINQSGKPDSKPFGNAFPISYNDQDSKNIAASLQALTNELVEGLFRSSMATINSKNICYSGGVALNCIANTAASLNTNINSLFVPPNANDSGLAFGQALYIAHNVFGIPKDSSPKIPYTGPRYKAKRIEQALANKQQLSYEYREDINNRLVELLEMGEILCRFYERSEAGPRALGHRSFLCRGDKENIRKILNDIKLREWFRPLAGMFTEATAEEIFETQIKYSYYMNTSAKIKEEYMTKYDGLSHVDRSTRPQILNQELCADTHDLMNSFFEKTKCLGCVNTSFNIQEPLVETPEQAIATFLRTGDKVRYLQLDKFLVTKK